MKDLVLHAEKYWGGALQIPLIPDDRERWEEQFNSWPAMQRFGMKLDLSHPVAARLVLAELDPFHLGGVGDASRGGGTAVNGAIIAGMFDGALGVAGALQVLGRRAGTVDLSIKMFRAVTGPASAFGWAVRRTGSLVFVEAVVLDHHGARCAQATGIVCAPDSSWQGQRNETPGVSEPCPVF